MSGSIGGGMGWLMGSGVVLLVLLGLGLIVAGVRLASHGHTCAAEPPALGTRR
jgi:hypothetical protein